MYSCAVYPRIGIWGSRTSSTSRRRPRRRRRSPDLLHQGAVLGLGLVELGLRLDQLRDVEHQPEPVERRSDSSCIRTASSRTHRTFPSGCTTRNSIRNGSPVTAERSFSAMTAARSSGWIVSVHASGLLRNSSRGIPSRSWTPGSRRSSAGSGRPRRRRARPAGGRRSPDSGARAPWCDRRSPRRAARRTRRWSSVGPRRSPRSQSSWVHTEAAGGGAPHRTIGSVRRGLDRPVSPPDAGQPLTDGRSAASLVREQGSEQDRVPVAGVRPRGELVRCRRRPVKGVPVLAFDDPATHLAGIGSPKSASRALSGHGDGSWARSSTARRSPTYTRAEEAS